MAPFAKGWLSQRDIRSDATMRLFCLPHAGSGAAAFYRWKRLLPATIDVCPVLLPGREMRMAEASIQNAVRLVDELMDVSAPYLDVPFAIFGHSMGALLAYEWAVRIQEAGLREPMCLFVSGRDASHMPFGHRDLHRLDDEAFLSELRQRYGGRPDDFMADAELREVFLPILRADLTLVETYRHGAEVLLDCPIQAFAGQDDHSVSDAGLAAWGELTRGGFFAKRFNGDHFYHLGSESAGLLEGIASELANSQVRHLNGADLL